MIKLLEFRDFVKRTKSQSKSDDEDGEEAEDSSEGITSLSLSFNISSTLSFERSACTRKIFKKTETVIEFSQHCRPVR